MGAQEFSGERRHTGVDALDIDSDAAAITVTQAEGEETTVRLTGRDGASLPDGLLVVEREGDALRIRVSTVRGGRWRRNRRFDARLEVAAPAGASLRVRTDAGTVRVEERHADVSVDARAGAVRIADVHGSIDVRTNAGAVQLHDTRGVATVDSDAGSVRLERHHGERVDLRTGAGELRAVALEVGELRARTEAGAVSLDFATPPVDVDASCKVGALSLTLPPDAYEIDQQVGSLGRARLEGIASVPGAARQIRVASTGIGRLTVAQRS